jgi:hypothetical protein
MATPQTAWQASAAHQELMVEFNERSADELTVFDFGEFLCECSDRDCLETVRLEHVEYLRIRGMASGLVLSSGHDGTAQPGPALYLVPNGE